VDYKAQSDATLATLAQSGDKVAHATLIERHGGIVGQQVNRLRLTGRYELADAEAEGFAGLSRAIQLWNPGRGIRLVTYAWWAVQNRLNRWLGIEHRQTDATATCGDFSMFFAPGLDEDRAERVTRVRAAIARLSPKSRTVVELRFGLNGTALRERETAEALGMTQRQVRHRLSLAVRLLRIWLDGEPTKEAA
jgi:RNA polymerase sigma factor (sigma-70 family)